MEKECLIKLTLALYKVTELFPSKEPLKFSIREKAVEFLAEATLFSSDNPIVFTKQQEQIAIGQILENIEVLKGYFEIAKNQSWVRRENFLVLQREYDKIKEALEQEFSTAAFLEKETSIRHKTARIQEKKSSLVPLEKPQTKPGLLKKRHKKILEVLKERTTAQVKDLEKLFPGVSKRTLRRDCRELLSQGFVQRVGDGNTTVYKLR